MISNAYKSHFNNFHELDRHSAWRPRDIAARSASRMQPMHLSSISDTRRRAPNVGKIRHNLLPG
jgi:hypothetical protein